MTTRRFVPTHEILIEDHADGARKAIAVRLVDGAAYTRAEWDACATADWERNADGEWLFQGKPYWRPTCGVSVRPWSKRVSHGFRRGSSANDQRLYAE